jgi:hypothetical protein
MTLLNKWYVYFNERFNPVQYIILVAVFFSANYVFVTGGSVLQGISDWPLIILLLLFFFLLRLYDDIKDFMAVIWIIQLLVVIIGFLYSFEAGVLAAVTIAYTLLMYKEFFISKWLREHLLTYAVSHTASVMLVSYTLVLAISDSGSLILPSTAYYFIIASWPIFTIFEVGRKTMATAEEKNGVKTYSKSFGKVGAILLAIALGIAGSVLLEIATAKMLQPFFLSWLDLLVIAGLFFLIYKTPYIAKIYRHVSSIYILLLYISVIL